MTDTTELFGNSLVEHGPGNDRACLLRLHPDDAAGMVDTLEELACSQGYSKVCVRIPSWETARFVRGGYHLEAAIPRFYAEGGSYCFMAKYLSQERKAERQPLLVREVLVAADAQQRSAVTKLPPSCALRLALADDADQMALLYRAVFSDRPTPLHDPARIRCAMGEGSLFFGVWQEKSLVALARASVDSASYSAELGDFATLPEFRSRGLAQHLVQQTEGYLHPMGIRSLFALTGAYSFALNLTLARNGYHFGGTLTNDNNSYGQLESVNLWHKLLQEDPGLAWSFLYREGPGW